MSGEITCGSTVCAFARVWWQYLNMYWQIEKRFAVRRIRISGSKLVWIIIMNSTS